MGICPIDLSFRPYVLFIEMDMVIVRLKPSRSSNHSGRLRTSHEMREKNISHLIERKEYNLSLSFAFSFHRIASVPVGLTRKVSFKWNYVIPFEIKTTGKEEESKKLFPIQQFQELEDKAK